MNSDNECEPCAESGFTWATLGAMAAMIGGMLVFFGIISLIWGSFPLKHVVRCAAQPLRILITYSQVTSQLGDVLNFQYPGLFGDVIEMMRPIMVRFILKVMGFVLTMMDSMLKMMGFILNYMWQDVWGLLFRALGPSECFGVQGFTSRWLLRVVALPLIMCVFVLVIFTIQYFKHTATLAKTTAN